MVIVVLFVLVALVDQVVVLEKLFPLKVRFP